MRLADMAFLSRAAWFAAAALLVWPRPVRGEDKPVEGKPVDAQDRLVYYVALPHRAASQDDALDEAVNRARDELTGSIHFEIVDPLRTFDIGRDLGPDELKLLAQRRIVLSIDRPDHGEGAILRHDITHYLMSNEGGSYPRWEWTRSKSREYSARVKQYMLAAHAFRDLELVAALPAVGVPAPLAAERDRYVGAANQAVCQLLGSTAREASATQEGADKNVFDALVLKARVLRDHRDPGISKLLQQRGCEGQPAHQGDPAEVWWECLKAVCGPKAQS